MSGSRAYTVTTLRHECPKPLGKALRMESRYKAKERAMAMQEAINQVMAGLDRTDGTLKERRELAERVVAARS